jgi:hypothetical protein
MVWSSGVDVEKGPQKTHEKYILRKTEYEKTVSYVRGAVIRLKTRSFYFM